MDDTTRTRHGGCLCGGVRYRVAGPMRPVVECHCERCRRTTGHVMAASGCEDDHLDVVADDTLRWYEASPGVRYGFCGTCGSTLFWRADDHPGWTSVAAGTIDPPTGLLTSAAWWTADASDYHDRAEGFVAHPYEPDDRSRSTRG